MSTEHTMEEATGVTTEHQTAMEGVAAEKGKGKAIQEHTEGEEESSDDDDMVEEPTEEPEDDDLAEIDTCNIIQGGRTRGKNIDWTAVDEDAMDDDDDEDEEYKAPVDEDDSMRE